MLEAALEGMEAVRDGHFDTGEAPTSHPGYDPQKLCKINDAHLADTGLFNLITSGEMGAATAAATGSRRVQVWASQLLIKPPGSAEAGNVGWHQDRQYWKYWQGTQGLFTMWIALGEVGETSGPMRFVRSSHRWGFLDQGDFFSTDQEALRQNIEMPAGETWEEVAALLPAGGASFHDCLTYHGSGPNTSDRPRCSIAVHLRNEKAVPLPDTDDFRIAKLGDPQFCPVIYQTD